MKVLFILNTPGFLRYFDVTIDSLLKAGNQVVLAFTRSDLRPESLDIYHDDVARPEILGDAPARTELSDVAGAIRSTLDYVRYLDPLFAETEYLRARRRAQAVDRAPWMRLLGRRRSLPRPMVKAMIAGLQMCERALPSSGTVEAFLRSVAPDVVLVTPLVTHASPQTDYVKSARKLGIPSGVCIASWDNLTNKGLMREIPDRVIVWNDAQRREAIELHQVPADRVVTTGAQPFDRWFGRSPSCPRTEFFERIGLRPDRPYVMFVGSTSNIAKEGVEETFVRRWITELRRSSDRLLSEAGILVRPHPDRAGSWEGMDLDGLTNVTLWPPVRPNSVLEEARTDYFDSLFYSSAVIGINTSAMIEAAVIGRPVLTVRTPAFQESQRGTLHFAHMLPENGGFLLVAPDLEEHLNQLATALAEPDSSRPRREAFVRSFIRPHGLDRPSNEVLVEAIESLQSVQPARPHRRSLLLYPLLWAGGTSVRRVLDRRLPEHARHRLDRHLAALESISRRIRPAIPAVATGIDRIAARADRAGQRRIRHLEKRYITAKKRTTTFGKQEKRRARALLHARRELSPDRWKILFVMRNSGMTRNWEWVIRELASRQHKIHIGYELERPQAEIAERIASEYPNVTFGYVPLRRDRWRPLLDIIRSSIDYLRYLRPEYRDAHKLRGRGRRNIPAGVAFLTRFRFGRSPWVLRRLDRMLRACERAIPRSVVIDGYLEKTQPDIVMTTPLVGGDSQHDYLTSARAQGRFTVLPVTSWDNLTTKGLVRVSPERVYVWNEAQQHEAVDMHGLKAETVVPVGAHSYDHWFDWRPSWTRREFLDEVGLDAEHPYFLYLCSSVFIAGDERPVVSRWVEMLRESGDPRLRDVGVLVRLHPANTRCWEENPFADVQNVRVWPPAGSDPRNDAARAQYYDSIFHSAGVVGINTTALIEAAIVGKRSYTILLPELRNVQEGTLHFHYLLRENGGPLTVARSPEEHCRHLHQALAESDDEEWREPFLKSFIRPHGLSTSAAPRLVDDLEEAVRAFQPAAEPEPSRLLRACLLAAVPLASLETTLSNHRRRPLRKKVGRLKKRVARGVDARRRGQRLLKRLRRTAGFSRIGGPVPRLRQRDVRDSAATTNGRTKKKRSLNRRVRKSVNRMLGSVDAQRRINRQAKRVNRLVRQPSRRE